MLEQLLGYVDRLEKEFGLLERYDTLTAMKIYIFETMVPQFIDYAITDLSGLPLQHLRIAKERTRWEELCNRYPEDLNKKETLFYFAQQLLTQHGGGV